MKHKNENYYYQNKICPVCLSKAEIIDWKVVGKYKSPEILLINCKNCNPKDREVFYIYHDPFYEMMELEDNDPRRGVISYNIREKVYANETEDVYVNDFSKYSKKFINWQI